MKKYVLEFPESWAARPDFEQQRLGVMQKFLGQLKVSQDECIVIGLPPGVRVVELDVPDPVDKVEELVRTAMGNGQMSWAEARVMLGDPEVKQPLGTIFAGDLELKGLEEKLTDHQQRNLAILTENGKDYDTTAKRRLWVEEQLEWQMKHPLETAAVFLEEMADCMLGPPECSRCQQRRARIAELGQRSDSILVPSEEVQWMLHPKLGGGYLWKVKNQFDVPVLHYWIPQGKCQIQVNTKGRIIGVMVEAGYEPEMLPIEEQPSRPGDSPVPTGMTSYICPMTAHWEPEPKVEEVKRMGLERYPITEVVALLPETQRDVFGGWDRMWVDRGVDEDTHKKYQYELAKMMLGQKWDRVVIAEAFEVDGRKVLEPEDTDGQPLDLDHAEWVEPKPDEPWTPGRKWL